MEINTPTVTLTVSNEELAAIWQAIGIVANHNCDSDGCAACAYTGIAKNLEAQFERMPFDSSRTTRMVKLKQENLDSPA